jgi:uncharacterized protein YegP (UPF0339 family)
VQQRIEFYRAKDGWRWRAIAKNGRILADSGEGYRHRRDCQRGAQRATEALIYGKKIAVDLR